ncbi:MAG: hypothetical protein KGI90_08570 [Burkholderiales bacterium]|nr:hypothetical protein [Burkholderiales bacterium]MDE2276138.1 hypothetical protein [Burkholderiales bacterium]
MDSDVVGLNYNCGGVTGVTDNLAQFQYISGQSCSFSIGGIDLGSAVGAPLMTPVDLVPGASPGVANAAVTDIARLLLSLDDDGDPGNGITISAAVRTTLGGMSLGSAFGSGGFAAAAQMIVSAAFPGRLLVDATTAANHLDLSLVGLFSGPYHCTYSALVGGVNTALGGVVISIATGVITGAGTPTGGGSTFTVAGTVSANGAATMSAGTTSTGATFQGTFLSDGTAAHTSASGTWNDPALGSGTWTCQHD